jgi:hypothetical protein
MSFSKELITVLDYLANKLGIVIDWTSENVMPYLESLCKRYIEYEVLNSLLVIGGWALALIVVVCFLIPSSISAKRVNWNLDYGRCWLAGAAWACFLGCVIGLVTTTISEGFHIIECWKLPEKVIIEYVQGLLNS